ncbi:hypothetical protein GCM10020221_30730 [Streptomyces thioluteus]|uniref:Ketoreductase domain-containing protein n=1 Tax=Streptomyces thioluteus TaxID=66431 RepID=A0ABP6JJE3_STRTU
MGALKGRTALVTGGGRGIGRAVSERLARDGARVAVHYGRDDRAARETVAAIEAAGGSAFALRAELGVPGDAESLWAAFDEHAEGVDILVNNAGTSGARKPVGETSPEEFDEVFALNTKAPFFITKLALDRMRPDGRVVNISTGLSRSPAMTELISYAMSKGALDVFTMTLAKEVGPRGITVNAVAPRRGRHRHQRGLAARRGQRGGPGVGDRGVGTQEAGRSGGDSRRGGLPRLARRTLGDGAVDRRDRGHPAVARRRPPPRARLC